MAPKKWYQDYRIFAPVAVALLGLVGTVLTLAWNLNEPNREGKADSSPDIRLTPPPVETPTMAQDLVSFPVIVMDDRTDDRLANAEILLDEQGLSQETDTQGRCTLRVQPGRDRLRLTVSKHGYQTQNVELTVFEKMDPVRIRLQPKG